MADTTFVNGVTPVPAEWLNDVNTNTYKGTVNVKLYGAKGDGVTDDTAAIQAALDQVNSTSGGSTVHFPRGDYLVGNLSLSGKKGLKLTGDAGSVYSVIKVTGKITCNNVGDFTASGLMFVGNVFSFSTRGLTGSPTANNWLFDMVDNCADWNVSGCKFYGFDSVFRPNAGATNGSYIIKIRDNYFGWNNTSIRADGILHWNIDGNCFSEDRVANIHITSGGEFSVTSNKFENSANALSIGNIYLGTGASTVVMNAALSGNTFHQCYGIYLNKVRQVNVQGNVVRQPKVADTLVINGSEEINVIGNELYGYDGTYRASGINIAATVGYVNVSGNVVRDYATGVYVSSDYTTQITGNTIGGGTYSVRVTGCTTDRRVAVSENMLIGTVRSDSNSSYWTERNNTVIAGTKFDNNDGKMDNYYLEGVWTPTPTSLTVVGTPTYTGTFTKVGRIIHCQVDINSTTSTASTGGTTYFSGLPYAATKEGGALSVTSGATQGGVGLVTGSRVYPASWSASAAVRMSFSYQI